MRITVATVDTACIVTWGSKGSEVTDSARDDGKLTGQVKEYLQGEFEFPVGDTPDPGATADFTTESRAVGSEFEMCSVMQSFPRVTGVDANVYTTDDNPPA